ncbi:MAG: hypothetical protein AAGA18_10915 [Verrucomicrobiota bacterium]
MKRLLPFIGLHIPYPRWTGETFCVIQCQSFYDDNYYLISEWSHSEAGEVSDWPEGFEVNYYRDVQSASELLEKHQISIEKYKQEGRIPLRIDTPETSLEMQRKQHTILSPDLTKNTEKDVENLWDEFNDCASDD